MKLLDSLNGKIGGWEGVGKKIKHGAAPAILLGSMLFAPDARAQESPAMPDFGHGGTEQVDPSDGDPVEEVTSEYRIGVRAWTDHDHDNVFDPDKGDETAHGRPLMLLCQAEDGSWPITDMNVTDYKGDHEFLLNEPGRCALVVEGTDSGFVIPGVGESHSQVQPTSMTWGMIGPFEVSDEFPKHEFEVGLRGMKNSLYMTEFGFDRGEVVPGEEFAAKLMINNDDYGLAPNPRVYVEFSDQVEITSAAVRVDEAVVADMSQVGCEVLPTQTNIVNCRLPDMPGYWQPVGAGMFPVNIELNGRVADDYAEERIVGYATTFASGGNRGRYRFEELAVSSDVGVGEGDEHVSFLPMISGGSNGSDTQPAIPNEQEPTPCVEDEIYVRATYGRSDTTWVENELPRVEIREVQESFSVYTHSRERHKEGAVWVPGLSYLTPYDIYYDQPLLLSFGSKSGQRDFAVREINDARESSISLIPNDLGEYTVPLQVGLTEKIRVYSSGGAGQCDSEFLVTAKADW